MLSLCCIVNIKTIKLRHGHRWGRKCKAKAEAVFTRPRQAKAEAVFTRPKQAKAEAVWEKDKLENLPQGMSWADSAASDGQISNQILWSNLTSFKK